MLTGYNGQMVERYEYDVYGVAYNGKFDHGLAGMGGNPYGFTGKRYEPEMGIYSFAFRDYNPQNMRWMTPDPIKDGLNWYQYCGADPVNWVDLLGLCTGDNQTNQPNYPSYTLPADGSPRIIDPLLTEKEELQ